MEALFVKEMLRFKRSGEIYLLVLLPLLQLLTLIFAVGRPPMDLKLGIVNQEIPENSLSSEITKFLSQINPENYSKSFDFTATFSPEISSTSPEKLSNKFLDLIPNSKAIKIPYDSFNSAFNDVKKGKLIGFLYIAKNYTEIFLESDVDVDERNTYTTNAIDVHLDSSNHQLSWFITQALYESYFKFDKKYLNKTEEGYPIRVTTWYGEFTYDFRLSIFSTYVSGAILISAIITTSNCLTASRKEFWNRTLIAGTNIIEILVNHLIFSTFQNIFQVLEIMIVSGFLIEPRIFEHFLMIFVLFMLIATIGSSLALLASILFEDYAVLGMVNMTAFLIVMVLQGTLWPLEGQPLFLQYFSKSLPTTLPSISERDILLKGLGFQSWTIQRGFLVIAAWFIPTNALTLKILKLKKFV